MTKIKEILPLVQIIASVALLAGVSAIVFVEFQDSVITTQDEVNDTIGIAALDTAYNLYASANETFWVSLQNDTVTITNSTDSFNRAGNWSVDVTAGTITAITGGVIDAGLDYNVSYTWNVGSDARNIFDDGLAGLVEVTGWLDLIALGVIAGAIMAIVLSSIGMMAFRRDQGGY